jgi:hypothetical protein
VIHPKGEAGDFEDWVQENPNVCIRMAPKVLEFWNADGLQFRVTDGPYLPWGPNATALFVNGKFLFMDNPFWIYDLLDEGLAVGGFVYWEGGF